MAKAVAEAPKAAPLPAHLQQRSKAKIGNLDSSDRIVPRIKLIQKTSTEPDTFDAAKPGEFWHTIAEQSLGETLRVVPIVVRKSYVLWAPRNDDRGILARANDAIQWDLPNTEFRVKLKDVKEEQVYNTGDNVESSGLAEFGSSVKGESNSRPAASLTYSWMFYLPDFPELSPCVVINTRSSIKAAKGLWSRMEQRPVEPYYQIYEMRKTDEKGDEGPYFGYGYSAAGYIEDEVEAATTKALSEMFVQQSWRANEERDEDSGGEGGHARPKGDSKRTDF